MFEKNKITMQVNAKADTTNDQVVICDLAITIAAPPEIANNPKLGELARQAISKYLMKGD